MQITYSLYSPQFRLFVMFHITGYTNSEGFTPNVYAQKRKEENKIGYYKQHQTETQVHVLQYTLITLSQMKPSS